MWLCGAETIGDRRAGLSEVKPGPPRGELSSPCSRNHPGETDRGQEGGIEQLSPTGAVQLRSAKGHAEAPALPNNDADSRRVAVEMYLASRPKIGCGAPTNLSKPVAAIGYSCNSNAIRGYRQVSTSSEK